MKLSNKVSVRDVDLKGKRMLMRVDFNVPVKNGVVVDNARIRLAVPTIDFIFERGAKSVTLMSHLGRPDGQRRTQYSLKQIVPELEKLSKRKVVFVDDCVGTAAEAAAKNAPEGSLVLLENLRFHIEEEGKGVNAAGEKVKADSTAVKRFTAQLSALGDIYVNDAFGTAHRAHASVVGISLEPRCAGLLLEKELAYFDKALNKPQRPFLSILGGAKVNDKIQLIESLLEHVDYMIIGGGMAYTFLKVLRNMPIGNSLYDEVGAKLVPQIMEKAKQRGVEILFPVDFVVSSEYGENGVIKAATLEEGVPDGFESLDCGPRTIKQARDRILQCKTIVWNGPQGVSEMQSFAKGSLGFVEAVVEATKLGAVSIVGGGDTGAFVERAGVADKFSHVSTGGGASLELLEGKDLPGVVALSDKH